MINIGLSPNLTLSDSFLALKLLFMPWKWKKGEAIKKLEGWFRTNTTYKQSFSSNKTHKQEIEAFSFNSARSAEFEILKAFGIGDGDEVLLQAFTCVAVPNSVLWTGAKPVYVDIDQSLTMDPVDLEKKITSKSKAIIVQHTFGQFAKLEKICQIGKKYGLKIIEDCAHTIKKDIQGDAAFFSFGRDKAVSSVFGGMAVGDLGDLGDLGEPSFFWIFQQLLHPVAMVIILSLYNWANLGKLILFGLQKIKLLSFPVYPEEKNGARPKDFPKKMPNVLAELALGQLAKLNKFEEKRKEIAKIYKEELEGLEEKGYLRKVSESKSLKVSWLRYPILVEKPEELRKFAKKRGIILGNWYHNVIDPEGTDFLKINYKQSFSSSQKGSCPVAEEIAGKIVNLPTYPRMKKDDVYKIIKVIKDFFNQ